MTFQNTFNGLSDTPRMSIISDFYKQASALEDQLRSDMQLFSVYDVLPEVDGGGLFMVNLLTGQAMHGSMVRAVVKQVTFKLSDFVRVTDEISHLLVLSDNYSKAVQALILERDNRLNELS